MKLRFLSALLTLVLAACGGKPTPVSEVKKEEAKKEEAPKKEAAAPSSDCTRGEPSPLMASGSEFRKISPQEAVETIPVDPGMTLEVRHFGCTHYALEFAFTWTTGNLPEPKVSLPKVADQIAKLTLKDDYKAVQKSIAAALRKMAGDPYKQPLVMSETENLTATTPSMKTLVVRYDVAL